MSSSSSNPNQRKKDAKRQRELQIKQQREAFRLAALNSTASNEELDAPSVVFAEEDDVHEPAQNVVSGAEEHELTFEEEMALQHTVDAVGEAASKHNPRKAVKMPWSALKTQALEMLSGTVGALDYVRRIDRHDGNAPDPLFTAKMKLLPNTVPVPSHWCQLAAFLSQKVDRESAEHIVPVEIEATDVRVTRRNADKKIQKLDYFKYVRCFYTGSPFTRRNFGIRLTSFGDSYETRHASSGSIGSGLQAMKPGIERMSPALREALGMRQPSSPPPWIRAMQVMKRLPPAYPFLKVPGMNAPIPDDAQFGESEGMWGKAPTNFDGRPLFPGIMGDIAESSVSSGSSAKRLWGSIPPPSPITTAAPVPHSTPAQPSAPAAPTAGPSATAAASSTRVAAPFVPKAFVPPTTAGQRAGPVVEQAFERRTDVVGSGLVAQGDVLQRVDKPPNPPPSNQ